MNCLIHVMIYFIRRLSLLSILTTVFFFVVTIITLNLSYISIRNTSLNSIYEKNDLIASNYANTLNLSFSFITSPLNYGKEYMNRYTIYNSTLNDFIDLSALNNTLVNKFINRLNLFYIVNDVDRINFEQRVSNLLGNPTVISDFNTTNNTLMKASTRNIYCPTFFITPLDKNTIYLPGLDVCNIEFYRDIVQNFLTTGIDSVLTQIRMDPLHQTFIDIGKRTRQGLVVVTLIVENIVNAYISNSENVSIKKNNTLVYTNCVDTCNNGIDKDIILINGDILIFTFFFGSEEPDITTFLFILISFIFFKL